MKKPLTKRISSFVLLLGVYLSIPVNLSAQLLAWDFQGATASGSVNATTNNTNLNVSAITRGAGLAYSSLADAYSSTGFEGTSLADAIAKNEYLEFKVSPKSTHKVSLSSLESSFRRSSTGPSFFQWQYSLDGFQTPGVNIGNVISFSSTATNGEAMPSIDLSGITALQNIIAPAEISIRLYGYAASSTAGTFALGKPTSPANDLAITGPIILPVNLISFELRSSNHSVSLTWVTDQEKNNKLYTIERSEDNSNFISVGEVKGSSSIELRNTYSFTDYAVGSGTYYYRLKQTNLDGTSTYTEIKKVKIVLNQSDGFEIYPNPVSDDVTISSTTSSDQLMLKLLDLQGGLRLKQAGNISSLNQALNTLLPKLAAGTYLIQLNEGEKTVTKKLVKD